MAEKLIRRMREGTAPWTEAWQPRWGPFRQVRDLGGHVRRGEQCTKIVYWQFERRCRAAAVPFFFRERV